MMFEEEWLFRKRDKLHNRYGASTLVAINDWAVIEWGYDAAAVWQRAEAKIGNTVFVGAVPVEPADDDYTTPDYSVK